MEIEKQKIEELEKKYKETLFGKINEIGAEQFESINLMMKNARNIGQSDIDIPNTSVTLNNKIIEISNLFKNAGISMFSSSALEGESIINGSLLGNAIIHDLIDKLNQSSNKLGEYTKTMSEVTEKKNEQIQALQNISPMRKFFSKIRAFFVPIQPVDFSLTEVEEKTLESLLQEYKNIDTQIWEYNLEDNLIEALVKEIAGSEELGESEFTHRYHAFNVPGLLEETVIPDLKKLGLEHLVPRLQEALVEEYRNNLSEIERIVLSDENMYLYVPDFSRKAEEPQDEYQKEQEGANAYEEAFGLNSFRAIDSTVSASERKEATDVICAELSQEKTIDEEVKKNPSIQTDVEIGG